MMFRQLTVLFLPGHQLSLKIDPVPLQILAFYVFALQLPNKIVDYGLQRTCEWTETVKLFAAAMNSYSEYLSTCSSS